MLFIDDIRRMVGQTDNGIPEVFQSLYFPMLRHYVVHNAWLEDGILLRNADRLRDIPGALIHGRFDFQALLENAYALSRAWPTAKLVVVDDAGHMPTGEVTRELTRATDGFR